MNFSHPSLGSVLTFENNTIQSLVVENQIFFRNLLQDIHQQINGEIGESVLSQNNLPLSFSKKVEFIDSPAFFSINTKPLLSKILVALEKAATGDLHFYECSQILQSVERFIFKLTQDFTTDIICEKLSISSILKSIGIAINDDYQNPLERFIDFMELTREFDSDKLFIYLNLRSYFDDNELTQFFETVLSHQYHILLIDSTSYNLLACERRLTIDSDLCEF